MLKQLLKTSVVNFSHTPKAYKEILFFFPAYFSKAFGYIDNLDIMTAYSINRVSFFFYEIFILTFGPNKPNCVSIRICQADVLSFFFLSKFSTGKIMCHQWKEFWVEKNVCMKEYFAFFISFRIYYRHEKTVDNNH